MKHLKAFSNSQLVISCMLNEYEAKKENMEKYLQKVKDLIQAFHSFNIQQIPGVENT